MLRYNTIQIEHTPVIIQYSKVHIEVGQSLGFSSPIV